jgi:stage II sporulation protein AA (anti-sigma F factor antagonist)
MEIQSERHQRTLVISLVGSFDALTADEVESYIRAQLDGGQQQIVLDLRRVGFMSSAGIRVLLVMLKQSRGMGGDLRLAAVQPGVQRTLEISGLVRLFEIYPSVEEAVRSFGPQES